MQQFSSISTQLQDASTAATSNGIAKSILWNRCGFNEKPAAYCASPSGNDETVAPTSDLSLDSIGAVRNPSSAEFRFE